MAEDGRKILRRLDAMAVSGPPRSRQQGRGIGDGIFELKAQRGLMRLFYFFDEGRIVVCTHLAEKPKPKQLPTERKKAKEVRADYLCMKAEGRLEIVEEL